MDIVSAIRRAIDESAKLMSNSSGDQSTANAITGGAAVSSDAAVAQGIANDTSLASGIDNSPPRRGMKRGFSMMLSRSEKTLMTRFEVWREQLALGVIKF